MIQHNMIKAWRLAKGVTVEWVAHKAGVTQSYISNIENGKARPSLTTISKIAEALDIQIQVTSHLMDVNDLQFSKNMNPAYARMPLEEYLEMSLENLPVSQRHQFGTLETPRYVGREHIKHWKTLHKKICAITLATGGIVSNINLSLYKLTEVNISENPGNSAQSL